MALEELTNELNVAKELNLAQCLLILVVLHRVGLACIFSLLLESLKVLLQENLLVHVATVVQKLFPEVAELEVRWDGTLALRLEVDLNNHRAENTVEFGVSMLNLSLAENGLHDDLKNGFVDLEALG